MYECWVVILFFVFAVSVGRVFTATSQGGPYFFFGAVKILAPSKLVCTSPSYVEFPSVDKMSNGSRSELATVHADFDW